MVFEIEANSIYEQDVLLVSLDYQLTEGSYRIVKAFYVNEEKIVLGAEFEIK